MNDVQSTAKLQAEVICKEFAQFNETDPAAAQAWLRNRFEILYNKVIHVNREEPTEAVQAFSVIMELAQL